jgi:hypothetical protein
MFTATDVKDGDFVVYESVLMMMLCEIFSHHQTILMETYLDMSY